MTVWWATTFPNLPSLILYCITPRYMQASEERMGKPLPVVSFNHPGQDLLCQGLESPRRVNDLIWQSGRQRDWWTRICYWRIQEIGVIYCERWVKLQWNSKFLEWTTTQFTIRSLNGFFSASVVPCVAALSLVVGSVVEIEVNFRSGLESRCKPICGRHPQQQKRWKDQTMDKAGEAAGRTCASACLCVCEVVCLCMRLYVGICVPFMP